MHEPRVHAPWEGPNLRGAGRAVVRRGARRAPLAPEHRRSEAPGTGRGKNSPCESPLRGAGRAGGL